MAVRTYLPEEFQGNGNTLDDDVDVDGDDGDDVGLSPSFDLPPTPPDAHVTQHVVSTPPSAFLYIERGRGAGPHYQFAGPPSPGDLKRIAAQKLDVFTFGSDGVIQYQADGSTSPVAQYKECQPTTILALAPIKRRRKKKVEVAGVPE